MSGLRRTAIEFVTIGGLGIAVAFGANAFRVKGNIKTSKNYFDTGESLVRAQRNGSTAGGNQAAGSLPRTPVSAPVPVPASAPALPSDSVAGSPAGSAVGSSTGANSAGTNGAAMIAPARPGSGVENSHPKHPYQEIDFEGVLAVVKDPNTATGLNVIVDARKDEVFEEGHIPGAIVCYPHEIDLYIDLLRPAVSGAEKVIVYCGGGDCEDSIAMCRELIDMNVPYEAVQLYAGGWKDWTARNGPAETGRN